MQITEALASKVLTTVDVGLVNGMGEAVPGKMCVEAAVCFALGLPHNDNPPCVGPAVRRFKISLNDREWSSHAARAKGMRRVAIAQLGSNEVDQLAFVAYVAEQTIRRIVPIAMRAAAKVNPKHAEALEAAAVRCEQEGTVDAAIAAKKTAAAYAYAAAAAADAAAAAADAADAAYAYARDEVLSLAAEIAVEALIKLDCAGTKFLYLTDAS